MSKTACIATLRVIACGLHGVVSDFQTDPALMRTVYSVSKRNSVESMAWAGAKATSSSIPDDVARAWSSDADATLYRRLQFDVERECVLAAISKAGFSYLPLKGILMADYYPDPSMRSMADNDILYGYVEPSPKGGYRIQGSSAEEQEASVARATEALSLSMAELGYSDQVLGHENADCFYKEPCFNFEMHRSLVQDRYEFAGHFANPWEKAIPDSAECVAFHYSASDEYIFHIVHAYKHYQGSGCGIRNAVDEYVFLKARGHEVDWPYVEEEMREFGIADFEHQLRKAASEAFCKEFAEGSSELSPESEDLLFRMIDSGTYGNSTTRIDNFLNDRVKEGDGSTKAKLQYLIHRVTLGKDNIADYHPVVVKYPVLMPFYVAGRLAKAVVNAPRVLREMRAVARHGKDGDE